MTLREFFNKYPELNQSGIAERANISPCMFRSYVCGSKNCSEKRLIEIKAAIRSLGKELIIEKITF